jgi:hypothetical protein
MSEAVKHLLKLSEDEQKQSGMFFARCSVEDKCEIMKRHAAVFHKLRALNKDEILVHEMSYVAFMKATQSMMIEDKAIKRKSFGSMSIEDIEHLTEAKLKRFYNNNANQQSLDDKIIAKWALVVSLRMAPVKKGKKPLAFNKIALFLKEELHLEKLATSTVHKLWQKLETNKKEFTWTS